MYSTSNLNGLFCSILLLFVASYSFAQESAITVAQDSNFEQLLSEKRKINASITTNDRYRVQIYSGTSDLAKKTLADFRKDNKSLDATILFNTPNYKVLIGNFKTRIEGERNWELLKKNFPNSLLIKPTKN
jgi:tRNA A37 N6-isopentenylltransferase MiaA